MWQIDPQHSSIGFSVKHMKFATVHGQFTGFRGTFQFDADHPWDARVTADIDAASIDTGIRKRDDHLRSGDFFDVATFPTIAFRSTRIRPAAPGGRNRWLLTGDLTMHGITRIVELAVEQTGAPGQRSLDVIEFTATTKLSRKNFGMAFYKPIESGELVVGDEVQVSIAIQANRQQVQ
jgi:polyisoprenoid-binding protein YceI